MLVFKKISAKYTKKYLIDITFAKILAGYNLNKIKNKEVPFLRRKLGIIFQDFQLLTDRSVAANLFFVMKATGWKDKRKMEETGTGCVGESRMGTKEYKMTHQLSGGEQQRVAIARALIVPQIFIA
jgi:cell division transport system ATP-binding protein